MTAGPRILVAHASAAGSTVGIAERIADTLRRGGCEVVCRAAGAAAVNPRAFDGLVIGSAVHDMAWLPPALAMLREVAEPPGHPVWCFSVGGIDPGGPVTRALTRLELRRVEKGFPSGFAAREHRFFGGIIVMDGVPRWGRLFYRALGGRTGDQRNWPAIEGWSDAILAELTR